MQEETGRKVRVVHLEYLPKRDNKSWETVTKEKQEQPDPTTNPVSQRRPLSKLQAPRWNDATFDEKQQPLSDKAGQADCISHQRQS